MSHQTSLERYVNTFSQTGNNHTLTGILRGIEKECLRITPQGTLAQTDHPIALGSALKHPHITTDYSEALLEFITQPFDNIPDLLKQLDDIHRFTYQQLEPLKERLWPASMPCKLGTDNEIPVARYGSSNVGKMKTVYRVGLGHRYGRSMQTIAGIHYNFSLPDPFWLALKQQENSSLSLQEFKTQRYFSLIRNFRRNFWLLIYLFGASPAVCGSFVAHRPHKLEPLDDQQHTFYKPHATSLRMGDLGYQSNAQQALIVCYNNLSTYLRTLYGAICKTHPEYVDVGVKNAAGEYQQLNTSLLQIENEFYSSIRPKHTTQSGETALQALRLRGVEYIEVRCVDLNPFSPLGITEEQIHVMDAFLLYCLFQDSPLTSDDEFRQGQENQSRVVYDGRNPDLLLAQGDSNISLKVWGKAILEGAASCATLLDQATGGDRYQQAIAAQFAKIDQPELTPSAQVVKEMHEQQKSFFEHTMSLAEQHRQYFVERPLQGERIQHYQELAQTSIVEQQALEAQDQLTFEAYLENYYQQYHCCG